MVKLLVMILPLVFCGYILSFIVDLVLREFYPWNYKAQGVSDGFKTGITVIGAIDMIVLIVYGAIKYL